MLAAVTKILLVSLYSLQPSHRARHAHSWRRPSPHLPSTVGLSSLTFISPLCSLLLAYTQLLVPASLPIMLLLFFPPACARQYHPIIPPLTTAQPYERKLWPSFFPEEPATHPAASWSGSLQCRVFHSSDSHRNILVETLYWRLPTVTATAVSRYNDAASCCIQSPQMLSKWRCILY